MAVPSEMKALLLTGDGYTKTPSGSALEAMEPYLEQGTIAVPEPGPSQVLIKVSLASINPSDVAFIKGQYGQPRVKGRPAGFEVSAPWRRPAASLTQQVWPASASPSPPACRTGAPGPTMRSRKRRPAFRSSIPSATRMLLR